MEVATPDFAHNENIALYKKLIAESESAAPRDQGRHAMLLKLLAEETAKPLWGGTKAS